MSKRIIIVDPEEFGNNSHAGLSRYGLPVYTIPYLDSLPENDRIELLDLKEGDAVLLPGSGAFTYLREYYHYGVRSENYYDCSKLYRLSLSGGSFAMVTEKLPTDSDIEVFVNPDFSATIDYGWFKHKTLSDYDSACRFLEWLNSCPADTNFGFDYEASGMPLDRWFELSGASVCTSEVGAFISFTDIRRELGGPEDPKYKSLLNELGKFLVARQSKVWTYNMQYEFQVSHRMLGVDLYNLCDSSVFNVLDGYQLKKYSLKWTANRLLGTTVWDTEFDYISDTLDSMFFSTVGKGKNSEKVLKVTRDNYKSSPEWKELESRYPEEIGEFETLINEYWAQPFMCIPSKILGHYCNLDSFYTLMMYERKKSEYSEDAINVFLDNIRLGARLHSGGLYINEEYRQRYGEHCLKMMAWSITYCARARCYLNMCSLKSGSIADPENYSPVILKMIQENLFESGDPVKLTKNFLVRYLNPAYEETGLDEGQISMDFGEDFAVRFLTYVKQGILETKFKGIIDETITRKKKLVTWISGPLTEMIGLENIDPSSPEHKALEQYLYYESAYLELEKVNNKQLTDIYNIPDKLYAFGQSFDLKEYSDFISKNYFKCKSPTENDIICMELTKTFPVETVWLAAISDSVQQMSGESKFYTEKLGLSDLEPGYQHFYNSWKDLETSGTGSRFSSKKYGGYPKKVFDLAREYYKNPGLDQVKEIWSNFKGYNAQETFFPGVVKSQYLEYEKPFDSEDFNDRFFFMRKMVLNYLMYKKNSKVLSTYIEGMFKANNIWCIESDLHIPVREADPSEPGAIEKCMVRYEVNMKKSKRWSSGFHTIISHSDLKDCITSTSPALGNDYLLTYFDISSAEVKAAGYASGDENLIHLFDTGQDVYIYTAKIYLGESKWETLDKSEKKKWRKSMKTVFLGVLYGLGKKSLAERLNCSEDEADNVIEGLYNAFPGLREYVKRQQQYPFDHNGYVNTMLGDKLQADSWKYFLEAKDDKDLRYQRARVERHGVNSPIQGGTSMIMASGFMNNIRVSRREEWKRPLFPIIVVHDSNTNYIPVSKVFDIKGFYDEHYTGYCKRIGPRITLLFDLLVGESYERAVGMNNLSENTIQFSGSAYSLIGIYDKIMNCPDLTVEASMRREDLVPVWMEGHMEKFISERGTCMVKDTSYYTIEFKRK